MNSSSLRIESENTKSYRTYPTQIGIESKNSKCICNTRITLRIECVKTGRPVSSTSWIFNWLLRKSLQSQWMLWIKLWTCPHSDNLFFTSKFRYDKYTGTHIYIAPNNPACIIDNEFYVDIDYIAVFTTFFLLKNEICVKSETKSIWFDSLRKTQCPG